MKIWAQKNNYTKNQIKWFTSIVIAKKSWKSFITKNKKKGVTTKDGMRDIRVCGFCTAMQMRYNVKSFEKHLWKRCNSRKPSELNQLEFNNICNYVCWMVSVIIYGFIRNIYHGLRKSIDILPNFNKWNRMR